MHVQNHPSGDASASRLSHHRFFVNGHCLTAGGVATCADAVPVPENALTKLRGTVLSTVSK